MAQVNLQALASEVGGIVVAAKAKSVTDSERFEQIIRNRTGLDYVCDKQAGGYRIGTKPGSNYLSPRLPKKQMELWVDAFVSGYEAHK